jgi:hypothetical protein
LHFVSPNDLVIEQADDLVDLLNAEYIALGGKGRRIEAALK